MNNITETNSTPDWLEYFFFMGKKQRKIVKDWFSTCTEIEITRMFEKNFKTEIRNALLFIKYDYWISTLEPSYSHDTNKLYFKKGDLIYINNDAPWDLKEKAKEFAPDWGSRLAKWYELVLFYAYRIAIGELSIEYFYQCLEVKEFPPNFYHSGATKIGGFYDGIENTEKLTKTKLGYMVSKRNYHYCPLSGARSSFYFAPDQISVDKLSPVIVLRKKPDIPELKSTSKEKSAKKKPQEIINAQTAIDALKEISDSTDFQENDKTITSCVSKLYEILAELTADSSKYTHYVYLFEVYLPQFYTALELYSKLQENGVVESQDKDLLTESVKKFYIFLHDKKTESSIDIQCCKIEFAATAKTLIRTLDK